MIGDFFSTYSPRAWPDGTIRLPWRLLLILGELALLGLMAYKLSLDQFGLVMVALLGIGAVSFLLRWPALGLVLLTFIGMVTPTIGPSGLNLSMVLVGLLFGLWLLKTVVIERALRLVPSRVLIPLAAFAVISLLSFVSGQLPWFATAEQAPLDAQLGGLAVFLLSAIAFFLPAQQVRDLRWLRAMTWVFLVISAVFIIGRAIPGLYSVISYLFQPRAIGGIFWAWLPAIALSQALFNRDLHPGWRVALCGLTLAAAYASFIQNYDWKSGWVVVSVAIAVVLALRSWPLALLMALLGGVAASSQLPEVLNSEAYSLSTRLDAWVILMDMVKVNPALGLGFGNYHWYTSLYDIRGWNVSFNSHNNYVDIIAQTGFLGLASFLLFIVAIGRLGWRLRGRVTDNFSRAYVCGALAGLTSTLVAAMLGDWLLPFVYNLGLTAFRTGVLAWLFLGGLVALEQIEKQR